MSRQHKCIFCEGSQKITKEHLFGEWLRSIFPRDHRTTRRRTETIWPDEARPADPSERRRNEQGHIGSMKLRRVCQPCNNGWMNHLEDNARIQLTSLIHGERTNLDVEAQIRLATWAAKTAMVYEFFGPAPSETPQEERSYLRTSLRPPDNWFIWIAGYRGSIWRELTIHMTNVNLSPQPIDVVSEAPYWGHATCFGLGKLFFCVVHGSDPGLRQKFFDKEPEHLIQIWPEQPRSLLWPPHNPIDDGYAALFANFFASSGLFVSSSSPGRDWSYRP